MRERVASALGWELLPLALLVAAKLALQSVQQRRLRLPPTELAYIDDGKRRAFGYVDHPPVAPFFAAVARWIWPDTSVLDLRLFPALCSTLLLIVTPGWPASPQTR